MFVQVVTGPALHSDAAASLVFFSLSIDSTMSYSVKLGVYFLGRHMPCY